MMMILGKLWPRRTRPTKLLKAQVRPGVVVEPRAPTDRRVGETQASEKGTGAEGTSHGKCGAGGAQPACRRRPLSLNNLAYWQDSGSPAGPRLCQVKEKNARLPRISANPGPFGDPLTC